MRNFKKVSMWYILLYNFFRWISQIALGPEPWPSTKSFTICPTHSRNRTWSRFRISAQEPWKTGDSSHTGKRPFSTTRTVRPRRAGIGSPAWSPTNWPISGSEIWSRWNGGPTCGWTRDSPLIWQPWLSIICILSGIRWKKA